MRTLLCGCNIYGLRKFNIERYSLPFSRGKICFVGVAGRREVASAGVRCRVGEAADSQRRPQESASESE